MRQTRSFRRRYNTRAALIAGLTTGLCGCALTYFDSEGNQHVIGLVDITIRASAAPETLAGDVVDVTSLGISIGQNAQGGYFTAGFNRQATAALRDNALVLGNPITALVGNRKPAEETSK